MSYVLCPSFSHLPYLPLHKKWGLEKWGLEKWGLETEMGFGDQTPTVPISLIFPISYF